MLKISNTKQIFSAALLGGLLCTSAAQAGEATVSKEIKPVEEMKKSAISGDLGVGFVSKYFSRGINNGDQGVIAQPYADLYFKVYEGEGFVNSATVILGIWSSLHSQVLGDPTSTTPHWQEFDYTPGIAIGFAKNFTLTLSYFEFDYPSEISDPQRSINASLAYNDSDLLGNFALHPHVTVLKELSGAAAGIAPDGYYYEFGLAPSHAFGPVTITVPLTVGLGDNKFYAGETYGYFSGGVTAAVALGFVPSQFGSWTFTTGATYYNLGSTTKALNNGEGNDFVFSGAIGVAF